MLYWVPLHQEGWKTYLLHKRFERDSSYALPECGSWGLIGRNNDAPIYEHIKQNRSSWRCGYFSRKHVECDEILNKTRFKLRWIITNYPRFVSIKQCTRCCWFGPHQPPRIFNTSVNIARNNEATDGCFKIAPLSNFKTRTNLPDRVFDADYESDVTFWVWRHLEGAPTQFSRFFRDFWYLVNYSC